MEKAPIQESFVPVAENDHHTLFEDAMNDITLASDINTEELLKAVASKTTDHLENKTLQSIQKEILDIVSSLDILQENMDYMINKLHGYRPVSEIYEMHHGKVIQIIKKETQRIHMGGIVMGIKFKENGTFINCKLFQNFFYFNFDKYYFFQKLSKGEQLILVATDMLDRVNTKDADIV